MTFTVPPDKAWLTAAEAAAEQLPDFPASKSQVNRIITDAGIKCRKRNAVGGGREFHWTDLSRAAREEYLKRHGVAESAEPATDPKTRAVEKDLRADARQAIVTACTAFVDARKTTKGKALRSFCAAYARGAIKLPDWVLRTEPNLAVHQLRCWERVIRNNDGAMPTDRRGRPAGSTVFDREPELKAFVVHKFAAFTGWSATKHQEEIKNQLGREVALRTLQSFLASIRTNFTPEVKALTNPDRYKSHHQPAFGSRSAEIVRINQRWEIDGTRADAMCRMDDGSLRRMALIALIDVFTRRAMVLVTDEGRAAATKALLRRAILAWGLPELLKADNGKDFIAQDVMRFCRDAGIEVKLSRPFHPEEKPHVERFIGTMNRGLFPMLPGFVGHNITDRKGIEARESFAHRFGEERRLTMEEPLTPPALQARIDAWLRDVYEHHLHAGIDATPHARAIAFAADARFIGEERALDALLMPPADGGGLRNVLKKGIRIANRWYIAAELGAIMGHRVHVRMDPLDLARIVVYDREGGVFICVAEDASLIGDERRMAVARGALAENRRRFRLIVSNNKAVDARFPAAGAADRMLLAAAGDPILLAPEASAAMEAAQAPRLVEHARALAAMDEAKAGPQHIAPTQEEIDGAAEQFAEIEARNAAPAQRMTQCDGYERPAFDGDDVGFWHWAQARIANNELIDAADVEAFNDLKSDSGFQLQLRIATKQAG